MYAIRKNSRVQILENGTLLVQNVSRSDCGKYMCIASNPVSNVTEEVFLHLDVATYENIKIMSILVGLQCAGGFLFLTLLFQAVRRILNK